MKLTAEESKYYKSGVGDDFKFTSAEAAKIDVERRESIGAMAERDVKGKKEKRKRGDFKSNEEYRYYQLSVYETATMIEHGFM